MVVSAAGLGGLLYWVAIFPVDQVKSAMQTDAIGLAERRYPTMAVTVKVSFVAPHGQQGAGGQPRNTATPPCLSQLSRGFVASLAPCLQPVIAADRHCPTMAAALKMSLMAFHCQHVASSQTWKA